MAAEGLTEDVNQTNCQTDQQRINKRTLNMLITQIIEFTYWNVYTLLRENMSASELSKFSELNLMTSPHQGFHFDHHLLLQHNHEFSK